MLVKREREREREHSSISGKNSNSAEHIISSVNNATVQKSPASCAQLNAAAVQKLTIKSLLQVGISFVTLTRALALKLDFGCNKLLLK